MKLSLTISRQLRLGGFGLVASVALAGTALAGTAGKASERDLDFRIGQALFERLWVPAPATTKAADGLGPLFTARACSVCHKAGAGGVPPDPDKPEDRRDGLVLRLGNDPVYGRQLQEQAATGLDGEGTLTVTSSTVTLDLGKAGSTTLPRPLYGITALKFGPLDPATTMSARLAPRLHGLGLLERVPDDAILALADPDDADGDGISGRPNMVETTDGPKPGRFGWKAAHPTISEQNAEAFFLDIGLSTSFFPEHWGDCTASQPLCRAAPHGDTDRMEGLEVPSTVLGLVDLYVRGLAVDPVRLAAPEQSSGLALFSDTGCAACHRPTLAVAPSDEVRAQLKLGGTISAFTDLLLHDMGDALADDLTAGNASGREWRTAPLWSMSKRLSVPDGAYLLHDGRARDVTSAILWHGGEAAGARDRFLDLSESDRQTLITFVESL